MKRLNIVLYGVLFAAVIVLYILHFTSGSVADATDEKESQRQAGSADTRIVYIDIDSVLNSYDLYYDLQQKFETQYKTSEAELSTKQKTFQDDVQELDYQMRRGLITRSDAQKRQQELALEEQQLMQLQNQLQTNLAEQQQVMMRQILNSIMDYLNEVKSIHKYEFVLGSQLYSGNILYANDSLNITKRVVEGLNEQYKKEKGNSGK